jgi:hypothetical protein
MMLTQLQITSARPRAKPYNLSDGQGLVLAVQATGSKLWRFRYRYAGRQKTLHIGPWPATSLADAREKCREARKAIAIGLDPALEKKREKVAARFAVATTFKDVALEWIAKCEREGRAEITLDKIRWLLGMAYPLIGSHPINGITPTEALSVLRKVEARGRYESARRMRSILSRVFRYGIATARCDRDVAADLRGALTTPKTRHHAATRINCAGPGLRVDDQADFDQSLSGVSEVLSEEARSLVVRITCLAPMLGQVLGPGGGHFDHPMGVPRTTAHNQTPHIQVVRKRQLGTGMTGGFRSRGFQDTEGPSFS